MNQSAKNSAFAKLLEYEKRSRKFAPGGKSGSGPAEEWSGVTFASAVPPGL
jgi:hypothetical protein